MSTATDQRSIFQMLAANRFSTRDVRGNGNFYLATKCSGKFVVRLYQTKEAADDRWSDFRTIGCGYHGPSHSCLDIHFRGVLYTAHEEPGKRHPATETRVVAAEETR
jgi:hypothetical protein